MVRNRRRHTAAYNFRVAMKALEGSKTIYGEPRSLDRETGEIRCIQTDAFCLPPSGGLGAEARRGGGEYRCLSTNRAGKTLPEQAQWTPPTAGSVATLDLSLAKPQSGYCPFFHPVNRRPAAISGGSLCYNVSNESVCL